MNGLLSQIANVETRLVALNAYLTSQEAQPYTDDDLLGGTEYADACFEHTMLYNYLGDLHAMRAQDEDHAANPEAYTDDASLYYE